MDGDGDGLWKVHGLQLSVIEDVAASGCDALVLVTSSGITPPTALKEFVAAHQELDTGTTERGVSVVRCPLVSGSRLILAATGELTPYDDVRSLGEAMHAGVQRAVKAGALRPVVVLQSHPRFPRTPLVQLLGALEALYVPLQIREDFPERSHKVTSVGVFGDGLSHMPTLVSTAVALEISRILARDIGGADPERMTPLRAAALVRGALEGAGGALGGAGGAVRVRVVDDPALIRAQYPLFAAVTRAADSVERHRGCIVFLEYEPPEYDRTLMFVGKGVTYDTGGCDIKAGGVMAGMSRDKCGAAAIAGFFKACALLKGRVKAVAALGFVRNSVGEEAYVSDELIKNRLGLPVRIGNTDAEGRMVMADLLAEMAERACREKSPHLYTVATLTGHAGRAVGPYTVVMDNHAAATQRHAHRLQAAGETLADMIEVSVIRREDFAVHKGRAAGDAIHQSESAASTQCARGHQSPAAFLMMASGLSAAGAAPYSHVDVAASCGNFPRHPTAAPLLALAAHAGLIPHAV